MLSNFGQNIFPFEKSLNLCFGLSSCKVGRRRGYTINISKYSFNEKCSAGVNYLVAEIERYSIPVEESVEVSLDYLLNAPFVKSSYAK